MAKLIRKLVLLIGGALQAQFGAGQGADDAIKTTLSNCVKVAGYKYCNPNNQSTSSTAPSYEGYGYCCNLLSSSVNCNEDLQEGLDCTLGDVSVQGEPLYRTYWTGMSSATCNTQDNRLVASTEPQQHVAKKMVIEERQVLTYEACYWIVGVEDNKYRDDTGAYIELRIEELNQANAYIYEGTSRENVTAFIEGNATAYAGVPYRAPISAKLIVVMTTVPNGSTSSTVIGYQVFDAVEYAFWFQPFVGQPKWQWYCALGAFVSLPFLILTIGVCCCKYATCCKKYCRCCVSKCCQTRTDADLANDKLKSNKVEALPITVQETHANIRSGDSELELRNISDSNQHVNDYLEEPVHNNKEAIALASASALSVIAYESRLNDSRNEKDFSTRHKALEIDSKQFDRTIDMRSADYTGAPPSEVVDDYSLFVPPSVKAANSKSRTKYSLNTEEQATNPFTQQQMMEVPPPETSSVLGGVSQSQQNAPVQFYRFTKERKQKMKMDLYQDPFNPMATQESSRKQASKTERLPIPDVEDEMVLEDYNSGATGRPPLVPRQSQSNSSRQNQPFF